MKGIAECEQLHFFFRLQTLLLQVALKVNLVGLYHFLLISLQRQVSHTPITTLDLLVLKEKH